MRLLPLKRRLVSLYRSTICELRYPKSWKVTHNTARSLALDTKDCLDALTSSFEAFKFGKTSDAPPWVAVADKPLKMKPESLHFQVFLLLTPQKIIVKLAKSIRKGLVHGSPLHCNTQVGSVKLAQSCGSTESV